VLAAAQEATGNVGQAIETLNKMATQPEVAVAALRQLAGLHLRKQEYGQAAEALLRARRAEPGNRDVTGHLVQVYLRSGKFDEAMREVKALQKREPKYAGGYTLEGDVHAALKQWTEAEKAYREALRFDADDGTAAAKLHSALYATNKRNEADAFGRKWLVDKPNDASMRMYLANRAMTDGNTKTAVGMYQEVIAIEPNNALALNNLAYLAGQLGDVRALGYAQRAVQLAPNNAMFLDTLGMLLVKQGDVQRAFANLDKARALAPDAPDLRLNYAKALAKAGRKDEARRELEELKSRPDVFAGKNEIDGLLKAL
jgi:putative PEP-CTERM system TPR-repeat lipoprotein